MYHGFNVEIYFVKNVVFGIAMMLFSAAAFGQKKQKMVIAQMDRIQVDAALSDWPALIDVANEGRWSYQVGQDATTLYLAVRVVDPFLQQMAIRNGVVFTLDTQQKKATVLQLRFPFLDSEIKRSLVGTTSATEADAKNELIKRSRGYFVRGFSAFPDGMIALQNGYGLQACVVAQDDALHYEAVIPKNLFSQMNGSVILGLAISDGFSYSPVLPAKSTARRGAASASPYTHRTANSPSIPKKKNEQTWAVFLETKIN